MVGNGFVKPAVIILLTSVLLPAASALAQDAQTQPAATEPSVGLEEIVVTAQKRSENLQDTPISMAALTSAALESRGFVDINDLRAAVPGLQLAPHPNSATTSRVFIRGVGNFDDQITQDPSVAVYVDGVYIARSQGLSAEIAELDRVEVLRGPQGSLYGRNATGGAINYITRAPDLGKFGVKQTFTYGNYDQFRSRTRVNIPVGDKLAVELAYLHSQKDGFVRNLGTGVARFGDQRRDGYRAAVLWKPTDAIDVRYAYDRSDLNDTPAYLARTPFYPAEADRPLQGSPFVRNLQRNDARSQGHNLTLGWDVADSLTLKSITGYRKLKSATYQDYFTGAFGPFPLITTQFDQNQKQFSQEFQAIGDALDGRLKYVLGAYYFDESANSFDITAITGRPRTNRTVTINNKAYALYGQATFRPTFFEGLYVTPSLRWSRDERQATLQQTTLPLAGVPVVGPTARGDRNFSNVSPGLVIGYDVSDDVNVYAKWVRGYKTGGYNVRASTIARFQEGFGDEALDSYELGLKSSWLDDRLRFNVAGFVAKYNNIQVNLQVDPTNPAITDTFNAGKATIKGVEIDLTARPAAGLTASVSYAYLHARYDRIVDPNTGANIANSFYFVEAPHHTLTASLQYQFPETPIGNLTAYVDYYLQAKKNSSVNDARYITGDYDLLDARLTLADIPVGFGKWRLSAFGKNLADKKYYVAHGNFGLPGAIFGQPRTYGLELTFEY
jgi:iron complex outermembrane receptor protein